MIPKSDGVVYHFHDDVLVHALGVQALTKRCEQLERLLNIVAIPAQFSDQIYLSSNARSTLRDVLLRCCKIPKFLLYVDHGQRSLAVALRYVKV